MDKTRYCITLKSIQVGSLPVAQHMIPQGTVMKIVDDTGLPGDGNVIAHYIPHAKDYGFSVEQGEVKILELDGIADEVLNVLVLAEVALFYAEIDSTFDKEADYNCVVESRKRLCALIEKIMK